MRKNRKPIEIFSLSFLDVVSCGFGAIILLLVISKISQPVIVEETTIDLRSTLKKLDQELVIARGEIIETSQQLIQTEQILNDINTRYEAKAALLTEIQGEYKNTTQMLKTQSIIKDKLSLARQSLTEEMKRLQNQQPVINKENTIGGISVNSEYIIFIIDTSGSMHNFAWPLVQKKMQEILKVHPSVKGIQVMNDMGDYMFSQYAGRWIPDSPGRRRAILKRLKSWEPFSNSSPEEGITKAIRTFYDANKQIALYIFGDDFSRGSIQSVIDTVSRLNRAHRKGSKRVRINAVGFPVLFQYPGTEMNIARFSALMRKLAEENNGSFVGLNSLK